MFEYEEDIGLFAQTLGSFIERHELPEAWFKTPDHIAIKCADALDYAYRMEALIPDAVWASEITMNERRLGTLELTNPISVGELGAVQWIEVMEPRPERVGDDVIGLEHMEFYYPEFDEITQILTDRKIEYQLQSNPGHSWVNIVINDQGQELKLNDKLLGDTVREEIEQGIARVI